MPSQEELTEKVTKFQRKYKFKNSKIQKFKDSNGIMEFWNH